MQAKALVALHVYDRQNLQQAKQQCLSRHSLFVGYTRHLLAIIMCHIQNLVEVAVIFSQILSMEQ